MIAGIARTGSPLAKTYSGSQGARPDVWVNNCPITIPAYMTFAALIYGVLMSGLTLKVGRPLVAGNIAKNEAEARFRFELTRLRENAESIALIKGERDERAILDRSYASLVGRWLNVVRLHGRLTWITNASGALVPVVPLVGGLRGLRASVLLAAALLLTQLWFPSRYWDLSRELDPLPSTLVLLRDLVLVALLVTLIKRWRGGSEATL